MPFRCPQCGGSTLRITRRLELPPDSRSDEITLQVIRCSSCGFGGIAVYQESRRGGLDGESVDHSGYRVRPADLRALERQIRACPRPGDRRCSCSTHRTVGRRNEYGRWVGLDDLEWEERFPITR